ncbi:MAG: type 1 glutamine amidotransferase domain-containing protein [Planctomycetes bacterium]|nr:type 1 glutamine amidotransferase domain-containing protein [Planctomycetota bacterium]
MKVLFVLTSHEQLGESGKKTGFWLEEFAAPYYVFKDAGAEITIASPKGSQPPIDPASELADNQTDATKRLLSDSEAMKQLADTAKLFSMNACEFDAIFYPGGHGPLWDLADDPSSIALLEDAIANDIPIGTVCHGPAAFRHVRGSDGRPFVQGKSVAGFSNSEEEANGTSAFVPFLIEDMLVQNGGNYTKAENGKPHVVVDGTFVSGQNPASSLQAGQQLLALVQST